MKKQLNRVKQFADQTFSRSGKPDDLLSEELRGAEQRAEYLMGAVGAVSKRLAGTGGSVGASQDPGARSKRQRKCPHYMLGTAMKEVSTPGPNTGPVGEDGLLRGILADCGQVQLELSDKALDHEDKVDQLVGQQLAIVTDTDQPQLRQLKRQLARGVADRESVTARLQAAKRHDARGDGRSDNRNKLSQLQGEVEDAEAKVSDTREQFARAMFALLAKETDMATTVLQYMKLQRAHHDAAQKALEQAIPALEELVHKYRTKPMYGHPLDEHLRLTGRTIAQPIELCVCALLEMRALQEEGLFRITAAKSRVERMCLSMDTGCLALPLADEYRDPHVLAGALKRYLGRLPDPLLTTTLYRDLLEAGVQPTEEQRLTAIWDAIHNRLPKENFHNLRYIIKFLAEFAKHEATNKMSIQNIAIVFAPNLLTGFNEEHLQSVMNDTASRNHTIELMINHADYFFPGEINYFVSYRPDSLFRDSEAGFGASFHESREQEDIMSRSLLDYNSLSRPQSKKLSHSRSNSYDTSAILMDGPSELQRTQSSSSLSDQSSPPQGGSPKPVARRKNKPAPGPPKPLISTENSLPDSQVIKESENKNQLPVVGASVTVADEPENVEEPCLSSVKRKSLELEQKIASYSLSPSVENISAVRGTVDKITIRSDNLQQASTVHYNTSKNGPNGVVPISPKPKSIPVAAPRTTLAQGSTTAPCQAGDEEEVNMRRRPLSREECPDRGAKPAIPERPPALRPQSFRGVPPQRNEDTNGNATCGITQLERAHLYSVDKQQVSIIHVGESSIELQSPGGALQRTHSIGNSTRPGRPPKHDTDKPLHQLRKLSQSESNILEVPPDVTTVPPSPRTLTRPPRPQIPAPPPPAGHKPRVDVVSESTDL